MSDHDNLITCLRALVKGEEITIDGKKYVVKDEILQFYKMATDHIKKNSYIYKYGQVFGRAINGGEYAHVYIIESTGGRGDKKQGEQKK